MAERIPLEISVVGSHTVKAHSVLGTSHTEYEVRVGELPNAYSVNRRYNQFRHLHKNLLRAATTPLAEFPEKTLHNRTSEVIEQRTAMLESYLRVAVLDPALRTLVLDFLSVPNADVVAQPEEAANAHVSEGEVIVLTLQNRLARDAANRMSALDHFNARFFEQHRHVKRELAAALIAELIPLCGDAVSGSLALEIIYKTISCSMSRSAGEFKAALLRTPVPTLALMCLDGHILGSFSGDSHEQAFAVISLLSDRFLHTGSQRSLLLVLNNNTKALETFTNWQQGTIVTAQHAPASAEWITTDCSDVPFLILEHRVLDGQLEVHIVLSEISASVQRVVDCIAVPSMRQKWHPYIISGKLQKELCPTTALVEFVFDDSGTSFILKTVRSIEVFTNGDMELTFHEADEHGRPGVFLTSYLVEQAASELRKDSSTSNESDSSDLLDTVSWTTKVTHKAKYSNELKKMWIEDFANGRKALKESWKALKHYAETERENQAKSHYEISLHLACFNKILSPSLQRRILQPPK